MNSSLLKFASLIAPVFFLVACGNSFETLQEEDALSEERVEPRTEITREDELLKSVDLTSYGLSFEIPAHFQVDSTDDEPGSLVAVYERASETEFPTFALVVSEQATPFSSFEDFARYMEAHFITEIIESSFSPSSEEELQSLLQKYDGHYSFEYREINGLQVLLHKRDFGAMIGNVYTMYLYANGKILEFHSESDHDLLEQIYSSLHVTL